MTNKEAFKEVFSDIKRNFAVPIILGHLLFFAVMFHVTDFEFEQLGWFFLSITILTSGTIMSIVYGILKFRRIKKENRDKIKS